MRSSARFSVLIIVVATSICNSERSLSQTSSVPKRHPLSHHSILGQPSTVATGTEEAPANVGFLQCVTDYMHAQMKHPNTSTAFTNLTIMATSNDSGVIVGHGAPGLICTGNGDHCADSQDLLGIGTLSAWQPLASQLKGRLKDITLVGCDIGSGTFGSEFLGAFANATGATIHAPNDTVQCGSDGITILNGGNWIQAAPAGSPQPRQANPQGGPPPSPKTRATEHEKAYRIMAESGFKLVPSTSVQVISFQHRGYYQKEFTTLPPERVHGLISFIDFAHPILIKGSLGSIVTGRLTLRMNIGDGQIDRQFVLLNDKLLEDRDHPTIFYKTTEHFAEEMSLLSR